MHERHPALSSFLLFSDSGCVFWAHVWNGCGSITLPTSWKGGPVIHFMLLCLLCGSIVWFIQCSNVVRRVPRGAPNQPGFFFNLNVNDKLFKTATANYVGRFSAPTWFFLQLEADRSSQKVTAHIKQEEKALLMAENAFRLIGLWSHEEREDLRCYKSPV